MYTMRKETSTNTLNKKKIDETCNLAHTISLIGGRWKPSILWRLMSGKMRYNELRKNLPDVSERILVLQLRELEKDGLVKRIVYAEVPPRVEYQLTETGLSMKPMLKTILDWGMKNRSLKSEV
jgi:DNA-binding HxlR family transcriptional regulator